MGFEYKDALKELLPDYMDMLSEQNRMESRGNNYWVCPFCNSGNNDNMTAAFHINKTRFTCFSCGRYGDIFDLVGHIENLPDDFTKRYNRALKIMRPYLKDGAMERTVNKSVSNLKLHEIKNHTEYLYDCHKNVAHTDYFCKKGLSREIILKFKLGYDIKKNAVIIPYNCDCSSGCIHRLLWDSDSKYCKFGNEIFNINALYSGNNRYVFVAEGQIDAMFFEEMGYDAIGLGGVNETARLVSQLKEHPSRKTLILALDNDKAGQKATGRLIEDLAEKEVEQNYIVDSGLYGKHKDANEFLAADRKKFKETIERFTRNCL